MRWPRGQRADAKQDQLRRQPSLRGCQTGEIQRLAAAGDLVTVPRGTVLHAKGTEVSWVYVVLAGEISGRPCGGTIVGDTELLGSVPVSETRTATSDVRALVVGRREFLAVLDTCPSFRAAVTATMARRLAALSEPRQARSAEVDAAHQRQGHGGHPGEDRRRRTLIRHLGARSADPAASAPGLVPVN